MYNYKSIRIVLTVTLLMIRFSNVRPVMAISFTNCFWVKKEVFGVSCFSFTLPMASRGFDSFDWNIFGYP